MKNTKFQNFLLVFLIVVIVTVSFLYLLRPVIDPDFFWHLKTGEWISHNSSLPSQDPFLFTSSSSPDTIEYFTLTSYWLSQLTFYLLHSTGGAAAIMFLRIIIAGLLVYFLIKRQHGDNTLFLGLLIIFIVSILKVYPFERPQVFSFLYFAILLFLLEKIRGETADSLSPVYFTSVPLLMLVWSNSHGGFLVGQITLALYVLTEGIKFIHPGLSPVNKKTYKKLFITVLLGIVFSLINPNTYHVLILTLNASSNLVKFNIEYKSTVDFLLTFNDYTVILNWIIMFLALTGIIINIKKTNITQVFLLAGLGYFSFIHVRFMPFFLIAALPVISENFSTRLFLNLGRVVVILTALFTAVFFAKDELKNIKNIQSGQLMNETLYPVEAVDFILANDLKGNMYNISNWGGYLTWRLWPERKAFIDGRGLNENIYDQAMTVNMATANKGTEIPEWKSILEYYNISYIVLPFTTGPSGSFLPIVKALLDDKDWILVFFKSNSLIFVKNRSENFTVIKQFSKQNSY